MAIELGNNELRKKAETASNEELALIKEYVLIPVIMTMIDRNLSDISASTHVLKRAYIETTQVILNRVHADLVQIRRELKKRNIKIFDEDQSEGGITCSYNCRGYRGEFGMLRSLVRAEVSIKISEYIQSVMRVIRK